MCAPRRERVFGHVQAWSRIEMGANVNTCFPFHASHEARSAQSIIMATMPPTTLTHSSSPTIQHISDIHSNTPTQDSQPDELSSSMFAYLKRITLEALGLEEIGYESESDDGEEGDGPVELAASDELLSNSMTDKEATLPQYGYRAMLQLAEAKTQIAQLQELCEEQQTVNTRLQVSCLADTMSRYLTFSLLVG